MQKAQKVRLIKSFNVFSMMKCNIINTVTLTSNIFVACPDDTLTFTCTVSSAVDHTISWTVTPPPAPGRNLPPATVAVSNTFRTATIGSDGFMFLADYSGLIGGMIASTLTTLSTVTALAGAMVECVAIGGTLTGGGGPLTIRVAGEYI